MENETIQDTIIRTLCTTLTQTEQELALAKAEIHELKQQIEGWRVECEIHERDNKELVRLQGEVSPLKSEVVRLTAQRDQLQADFTKARALVPLLTVAENQVRDLDAQCKSLYYENEDLKKRLEKIEEERVEALWRKAPGGVESNDR